MTSEAAPSVKPVLSETMQSLVDFIGKGGTIARFPGGYWAHPSWTYNNGPWWGATTVEALVKRKVAAYTKHQQGRNGHEFPIEAVLHA